MGNLDVFSIRLKSIRNEMDLSQRDFAEKVGCTAATLSAYENNTKNPSLEIVKNIAEKCNISIDWLCGLSDNKYINREFVTFSDAINMFFELERVNQLYISPEMMSDVALNDSAIINFRNDEMKSFIKEWIKMKELHDSNSIDDDVYNLWKEKTLLKYKIEIAALPFE